MTVLVGHDGTGWSTTDEGLQAGSTQEIYQPVTGLATGTATAVQLYVSSWDGATELSVALYTAAGVLVAESDVISSAGGTGLRTATINAAVTASTSYLLVVFANGYWGARRKTDGTGYTTWSQAIGNVGSAPASFTPAGTSNSEMTQFVCYLEGDAAGGVADPWDPLPHSPQPGAPGVYRSARVRAG